MPQAVVWYAIGVIALIAAVGYAVYSRFLGPFDSFIVTGAVVVGLGSITIARSREEW